MRVIVVGAGLSGLATAYRVLRAGIDVVVLEARSRVGGRAWQLPVGDAYTFEAGCEVLDDAHGSLIRLAGELGVAIRRAEPWAGHGEPDLPRWLVDGERSAGDPPLEPEDLALYRELEEELSALAGRIDPLYPEQTDSAGELDATTVGAWLRERRASRRLLAVAETWYAVASASVPIEHMSLLALATKLAAGAAPHGLRLRFDGGPSALADRLASELEGRLRLGAAAAAVGQSRNGVRLRLADGTAERGDRAVIAIPLTVQRDIRFDPPLPPKRHQALAQARYGEAVKAAVVFAEPFWRGRLPVVSDRGVLYEPNAGRPVLGLFAGSTAAARLGALQAAVEEILGSSVPAPRAAASVCWGDEPFSKGSYLILGAGQLTSWGRHLADPHGRVHFAGSETSTLPSYMEGAIRAAERCAREVLASGR